MSVITVKILLSNGEHVTTLNLKNGATIGDVWETSGRYSTEFQNGKLQVDDGTDITISSSQSTQLQQGDYLIKVAELNSKQYRSKVKRVDRVIAANEVTFSDAKSTDGSFESSKAHSKDGAAVAATSGVKSVDGSFATSSSFTSGAGAEGRGEVRFRTSNVSDISTDSDFADAEMRPWQPPDMLIERSIGTATPSDCSVETRQEARDLVDAHSEKEASSKGPETKDR
jgi:hypothetical protein